MQRRTFLAAFLVAGLVAVPFVAFASAAPGATTLVYLRADDATLVEAVQARPDVTVRFDLTNGWFSAALPAGVANRLAASGSFQVEAVSTFRVLAPPWCGDNPDHPACGNGDDDASDRPTPDDPTPWGIEATYNDATVTSTSGGLGIDVAVLDTGVFRDHLDLTNRVELCRDFTGGSVKENSCDDGHGHGTHVAGTILADAGSDNLGIYGVAPEADLLAVLATVLGVLLLLTYLLVYAPVGNAQVDAARNPALVLGIVLLILTGVAGILLIVVYVKLDRLRTLFRLARHGWLRAPTESEPSRPRFCPACGAPLASPEGPCPECGHVPGTLEEE